LVQEAREVVKEREAELFVNGGNDEYAVTGSNAEARAAALEVCKANDKHYQDALARLREVEREYARAETDMDIASQAMRGSRLILEYATSYLSRLAAAEGRDGFERKVYP